MNYRKKSVFTILLIVLLLFWGGCIRTAKYGISPSADNGDENGSLTLMAGFSEEDGTALGYNTVRFSSAEGRTDYFLDRNGELQIADLPRRSDLLLTVFDRQGQGIGAMTLSFSEGAVIDATTDENGAGHITLREDTDVIALSFSLLRDGSLQCSLCLT